MSAPAMTCHEADELAGLYVLDALESSEMDAVSGHLAGCPESHAVFSELAASGGLLLETVEPQDTPAGMRDRVMAAVASTPQEAAAEPASVAPEPAPMPPAVEAVPVADDPPAVADAAPHGWRERIFGHGDGQRGGLVWSGIAAGALAVVLVAVGVVGTFRLAADQSDRLDLLRQAVAAAATDQGNVAVLAGAPSAAGPFGYAVFPDDGDGFIVIDGLQPPGADNAYQAWYLVDGVPASAGLLTLDDDGLGTLTGLEPDAGTNVIAVTVEALPGAAAPTGDPILAGELRTATASSGIWLVL